MLYKKDPVLKDTITSPSPKFDRHYALTKFNYFNGNLLIVSKGTWAHEDEDGKRLSCLIK
jgi:hypothetical protein